MTEFEQAIADIERPHNDAGSLAMTVEHHWPTIKSEIERLQKIEASAKAVDADMAFPEVLPETACCHRPLAEALRAVLSVCETGETN